MKLMPSKIVKCKRFESAKKIRRESNKKKRAKVKADKENIRVKAKERKNNKKM